MSYFFGREGGSILFDIHTAFIILLVIVVCITLAKTIPKLIRTKKKKAQGMIENRVNKSFAKVESNIKGMKLKTK